MFQRRSSGLPRSEEMPISDNVPFLIRFPTGSTPQEGLT